MVTGRERELDRRLANIAAWEAAGRPRTRPSGTPRPEYRGSKPKQTREERLDAIEAMRLANRIAADALRAERERTRLATAEQRRINKARRQLENRCKKYGISVDEYEEMLASQCHQCAICGYDLNESAPSIDHDHACCSGSGSCGRCVRGLLCSLCNIGLSRFEDDPERLANAAVYLMKFKTKEDADA